ncbi:hypothetical protein ABT156_36295, partial [Streptomyces sp. NPDC001833]
MSWKGNPVTAWEDLVTTALLGTDRRPPATGGPAREAPVALLDEAAVAAWSRRRHWPRPRSAPRPAPGPWTASG